MHGDDLLKRYRLECKFEESRSWQTCLIPYETQTEQIGIKEISSVCQEVGASFDIIDSPTATLDWSLSFSLPQSQTAEQNGSRILLKVVWKAKSGKIGVEKGS